MFFVVLFICLVIITTIVVLGHLLIEWDYDTRHGEAKIKFEAFKKFYLINPERWTLESGNVVCKIVNESRTAYRGLFYEYDKEKFYFTFIDYLKYKRFCKQITKNKIKEKHMRSTANMIGMVKKDIANMEELAEQQKKQAMDNINSILDRL